MPLGVGKLSTLQYSLWIKMIISKINGNGLEKMAFFWCSLPTSTAMISSLLSTAEPPGVSLHLITLWSGTCLPWHVLGTTERALSRILMRQTTINVFGLMSEADCKVAKLLYDVNIMLDMNWLGSVNTLLDWCSCNIYLLKWCPYCPSE